MFTGYLVGYYAFRALCSHSPAMVSSSVELVITSFDTGSICGSNQTLHSVFVLYSGPVPTYWSLIAISYSFFRVLPEAFLDWLVACLLRHFSLLLELRVKIENLLENPLLSLRSRKRISRLHHKKLFLSSFLRGVNLSFLDSLFISPHDFLCCKNQSDEPCP